jgi:hypothetical protein
MDLSNRAHPMSASERSHQLEGCVRDMTAARSRNGDAYKTAARCVMSAADENAATVCLVPLMGGDSH